MYDESVDIEILKDVDVNSAQTEWNIYKSYRNYRWLYIILNGSIFYCEECQINQFKLNQGYTECFNCIDNVIGHGLSCLGSESLEIDYNFWVSAVNTEDHFVDIRNISNADTLFSVLCAVKFFYIHSIYD